LGDQTISLGALVRHSRTNPPTAAGSLPWLPIFRFAVRVGPFLVDFCWPAQQLIVETDGYRYHRGRQAFEDDRVSDLSLQRRGFRVIRVTYRQLSEDPAGLAAALRALL
jgi:very-short-patch-repair endonuclease